MSEKGSNLSDSVSGVLLLGAPNKRTSLKQTIVEVLSKEWPLSAKQLFHNISKANGVGVTYQGVHKALFGLLDEGVLSKDNGEYLLSPAWIGQLQQFSSDVSARYAGELLGPANQAVFSFDSLYEADKFLVNFIQRIYSPEDRLLALHWSHFWIPLFFSQELYAKCRTLPEFFDIYSITPANTVIDKWCHSYWDKNNWKTAIQANTGLSGDLLAYRDFVILVFYSPEAKKAIEKAYSSTKRMSDFDTNEFFETVFESKSKSHVAVIRSAELAESVKAEIVGVFKHDKIRQ